MQQRPLIYCKWRQWKWKSLHALQQQVKEYSPVTDWTALAWRFVLTCLSFGVTSEGRNTAEGKKWGRGEILMRSRRAAAHSQICHDIGADTKPRSVAAEISARWRNVWSFSKKASMHQFPTYAYNITAKISFKILLKTTILAFWKSKLQYCTSATWQSYSLWSVQYLRT